MKEKILQKKDILISVLLFVVCCVIRLIYISSRDIALDEPFTLYYSQQSIGQIISMLYGENNPPLHFIFLHFWIKLFGIGTLSVRLPSLLFGSLCSVVLFSIGKRYFTRTIGIASALILCFSTMHIFFSHEARVYPLFCLLTAASLYFFLSVINDQKKKSAWGWLFLMNFLLIYSHYFGFYVLFAEALTIFFLPQRRQLIKPFFILFSVLALCYLPMIMIFLHRFGTATSHGTWVASPGVTEVYGNLNRFLNNRINTAVLIVLFSVNIFLLFKKQLIREKITQILNDLHFRIVLIWFVFPYLFMFFISFQYPMFIDRYILFTSIPFYLCVAFGLYFFSVNNRAAIISIFVFIASMIATMRLNPDNNRRLREVAEKVTSLKNKDAIVLLAPDYAYMGFAYHYNLDYFKKAPETVALLKSENIYPVIDTSDVNGVFKDTLIKNKNCIYIQAGTEFSDPGNTILNALSSKFKKKTTIHVFEIYDIHYFSR